MSNSYRIVLLVLLSILLSSFVPEDKPDITSLLTFVLTKHLKWEDEFYREEVREFGHISVIFKNLRENIDFPQEFNGLPIKYKTEDELCDWVGENGIVRKALIIGDYKKTGKYEAFLYIKIWTFKPTTLNSKHACRRNIGPIECGGGRSIKRKYRNLSQHYGYSWDESKGWQLGGIDYVK